jgi:hypothetical protein
MQVQIDIGFDQLLKIVKTLSMVELRQLKAEIDNESGKHEPKSELEKLLLNGPRATKEQLEVIENNRKRINQWRN